MGMQQRPLPMGDSTGPFPSLAHRNHLRRKAADGAYSSLTDDELWHYHAYDYAWRRVFLLQKADNSPADKPGKWFDKGLVEDAQVMLLTRYRWGRRSREEPAQHREARERREALAAESGYADFEHMMRFGLQHARRPGEASSGSKSLNQVLAEQGFKPTAPAREIAGP